MNFKRYHVSKNLFDKNVPYSQGVTTNNITISGLNPNKYYTCSTNFEKISGVNAASLYFNGGSSVNNGVWSDTPRTFKPNSNGECIVYIRYKENSGAPEIYTDVVAGTIWVMVNEGSTPLDYEPYSSEVWHDIPHYIHKTATDILTTLPDVVYVNDTTETVGLKGNMSQAGTPTPTTPIQPSETGERTGNLFDYTAATLGKYIDASGQEVESSGSVPASKLNHTDYITIQSETNYNISATSTGNNTCVFCWFDSSKTLLSRQTFNVPSGNYTQTAESPLGAAYMIINYITSNQETVMVNIGSTALDYQPYGYKIPISSANTTTPVYLGEVQSTRRIKKLVLTGQEDWNYSEESTNARAFLSNFVQNKANVRALSSHYAFSNVSYPPIGSFNLNISGSLIFGVNIGGLSDFKTYLQQQYTNGTPVTVWYVLANSTTGIVNEPLRKIGDYADEVSGITIPTITGKDNFDVLTTLKPSEVELTYTGWHDSSVKERDGSEWKGDDAPALLSFSRPEPTEVTETTEEEQEVEDEQSI